MTRPIIKLLACSILLLPVIVGAQAGGDEGYLRLVGLPFEQRGNQDINVYIQALYRLAIGVAASLAVLRLILAGAQYMFTDVVTKKADAKKNVQSSLIGLLIVLSAVLILNTINPQLTNLEALNINQVTVTVDPPPIGPDDPNTVAYWCNEYGETNCSVMTCDGLRTDYWIIWLVNEPINQLGCQALCTFYGGEVIEQSLRNTGRCVYPTDYSENVQRQIEEASIRLASELDESIPENALVASCLNQGGPIACQQTRQRCTSGAVLRDGVRGTAEVMTTRTGERVIVCTPSN